jgi:hypothetical protein
VQASGRYYSQLILVWRRMPWPVVGAVLSGGNDLGAEEDSASSGEDNLRERERERKFG